MQNPKQHNEKIESFRGWSMTALYYALAIWALIFCILTFKFWGVLVERAGDNIVMPAILFVSAAATFIVSAPAGTRFFSAMRKKQAPPLVEIMPFILICITIVVAQMVFTGS
jgi:hypothetical protein